MLCMHWIQILSKNYTNCFDQIYVPLKIKWVHSRSSCQKLNVPHQKINSGEIYSSLAGFPLWKNLNETLKTSTSLNPFLKKTFKKYFTELKKRGLITVFVSLKFQSKYIHLNLTVYKSFFKIFSFLLFL